MIDIERLVSMPLTPREEKVPVPQLACLFPDGEEPVWIVRGLTGEEMARVEEESQRHSIMRAVIQVMNNAAHAKGNELVEAIERLVGYGPDVPESLCRQHGQLVYGSVYPKIDRPTAVKLSQGVPAIMRLLREVIKNLTEQGPDLGKS